MSDQLIGRGVVAMEVDGSQAEASMAKVVQSAERMERAVAQRAGDASAALAGVGKGAAAGANELDSASKRYVASLEREIAAMTLSRAEYRRWEAQAKGISEGVYAPLIQKLDEATKAQQRLREQNVQTSASLGLVGVSAGQAQAAMRQLPAQITDIVTGLAGGMPIMTILIQQGGQLRDSFGGFGNMFKAIAAAVPLAAVGLGGLAAIVGGLAVAYAKGSEEQAEWVRGLSLSGNAAGATVGQLTEVARAVDRVVGTQAQASEVLAGLVSKGGAGAAGLQLMTEAAIRLERVGGPAVSKTVEQFNSLAKDPAAAAKKLNEETNFLTIQVYRQIKALQEHGRESEATALAQTKFAEVMIGRTKDIEAQLGSLERTLVAAKGFWKEFWDAALNVGRPETLEDKLAKVEESIKANARRTDRGDSIGPNGPRRGADSVDAQLRQQAEELRQQIYGEREAATASAARADSTKRTMAADEEAAKAAKRHAEELKRLQEAGQRLLVSASESLSIARMEVEGRRALTDAEKDALKAMEALRDNKVALTVAGRQQLAQDLQQRIALEAITSARKEYAKAQAASASDALAAGNKADDVARQVQQQREFNASIGKTTEQLRALEQAKLDDAEASAMQAAWEARRDGNESRADNIDREVLRWRELKKAKQEAYQLTDAADLKGKAEQSAVEARKAFDALFDPSRAKSFADVMSDALGSTGNSLKSVTVLLENYGKKQAEIERARDRLNGSDNIYEKYYGSLRLATYEQGQQLKLYGDMAGAARGFFKEGSDGYKAMSALEAAFTITQLAQSFVRGQAAASEAVINQGKGDPYTSWARMAAMAAAVAQLGYSVGFFGSSGGAGPSAADRQKLTGTGTVLGDASAKSESIADNIKALEHTASTHLEYARGMLDALHSIEASLSGLGGLIVRSNGGGITTGLGLGIQTGKISVNQGDPILKGLGINDGGIIQSLAGTGSLLGKLGELGQSLWGKTKAEISDSGLSLLGSVSQLVGGSGVQRYADVATTTSSWFGLKKSTSTDTVFGQVEDDIAQQFGLVFKQIGDTVKSSASLLGRDGGDALSAAIGSWVVDVPRLSLKDLKGDELQAALSNMVSSVADNLTSQLVPGLDAFEHVGEGYYETLVRVASGVELAGYQLDQLGVQAVDFTQVLRKQGDVGAEIVRQSIEGAETASGVLSNVGTIIASLDGTATDLADTYGQLKDVRTQLVGVGLSAETLTVQLLRGAGGLDKLGTSLDAYSSAFFTEQERTAATTAALTAEFSRLGLAMPASRADFRRLVSDIAASGEQGERTAGKLIGLADALDSVFDAADRVATERQGLEQRLLQAQGNTIELRRLEREALDASNRALYDYVVAQEDQRAALTERQGLEQRLLQVQGNTAELRRREREALDESNRALYDYVVGLEDQRAALERQTRLQDSMASLRSSVLSGVATAFSSVEQLIGAEKDKIKSSADVALQELEANAERLQDAYRSLSSTLTDSLRKLRGQIAGDDGRGAAVRTLEDALTAMRAGRAIDMSAVQEAAGVVADLKTDAFKSQLDWRLALSKTATLVRDVQSEASNQLSSQLASIAAQQVKAETARDREIAVLDKQLAEARSAAQALGAIDSGVQTVAQAIQQLGEAIMAAKAVTGQGTTAGGSGTSTPSGQGGEGLITNKWLKSGGTEVWQAQGGAVGVRQAGAGLADLMIRGKTGNLFTAADATAWVNARLQVGDIAGIHARAVAEGIDSSSLDALMGYKPGTSLAEALRLGLPAFEMGTPYVPKTGLALVHQGERVITATDNAAITRAMRNGGGGGAEMVAELRMLRSVVEKHSAALDAIAISARRTADSTEQIEFAGLPA